MSRGRKLKTKSSPLVFVGGSSLAAAGSGSVNVATETRSPKFDFMNSAIFVFSSSGEGNGGGGFCSMLGIKKVARKSIMATARVNLTLGRRIRSSSAKPLQAADSSNEIDACSTAIAASLADTPKLAQPGAKRRSSDFYLTELRLSRKELRHFFTILWFGLRRGLCKFSSNFPLPKLARKDGASPLSIPRIGSV